MPDRQGANRLSMLDDMYFQGSRLGFQMNNQWIWRFDEEFPRDRARTLHARLQAGPLSRLVRQVRVPTARNRWVPAPPVSPLHVETEPVADDQAWINAWAARPLDLVRGPSWEMAYAPREAGGTLIMINASHAVTDGKMIKKALLAAIHDQPVGILPDDSWEAAQVRRRDDLRDAARSVAAAARAGLRGLELYRSGELQKAVTAARQPARPGEDNAPPDKAAIRAANRRDQAAGVVYEPPMVSFTVPAADWEAAAAARGGTSNSLFLAMQGGIVEAMGRISTGEVLRVSTPVDGTTPETEMRSNNTHGITLEIEVREDRYDDLTPVRAEAKRRYVGLADGTMPNVMVELRPLMQLLPDLVPDALLRFGAVGSPVAICTASNLGKLEEDFCSLGHDRSASSIVSRGVVVGMSEHDARAGRGAISIWLNQCGDTMTASAWGMDPDAVPDPATLRSILTAELQKWGLSPMFW